METCRFSNQWLKKLAPEAHYHTHLFSCNLHTLQSGRAGPVISASQSRLDLIACSTGPTWNSFNELISSNLGAASCVCLWVLALLMSLYLSNVVGSPCVSSQGNSRFEWGLADSFKRESWNTNKAAHSAHPKLHQHNKQKGADMSPYRASHWWGWHWKIPAWACPRVHHKACAHK